MLALTKIARDNAEQVDPPIIESCPSRLSNQKGIKEEGQQI
jgi:hypothetical protein